MGEPIYISEHSDGYREMVTHVDGVEVKVPCNGGDDSIVVPIAEKNLLEKVKRLKEEAK